MATFNTEQRRTYQYQYCETCKHNPVTGDENDDSDGENYCVVWQAHERFDCVNKRSDAYEILEALIPMEKDSLGCTVPGKCRMFIPDEVRELERNGQGRLIG